jgi:hypothetical protein
MLMNKGTERILEKIPTQISRIRITDPAKIELMSLLNRTEKNMTHGKATARPKIQIGPPNMYQKPEVAINVAKKMFGFFKVSN